MFQNEDGTPDTANHLGYWITMLFLAALVVFVVATVVIAACTLSCRAGCRLLRFSCITVCATYIPAGDAGVLCSFQPKRCFRRAPAFYRMRIVEGPGLYVTVWPWRYFVSMNDCLHPHKSKSSVTVRARYGARVPAGNAKWQNVEWWFSGTHAYTPGSSRVKITEGQLANALLKAIYRPVADIEGDIAQIVTADNGVHDERLQNPALIWRKTG